MRKRLALSTIRKAFKSLGFVYSTSDYYIRVGNTPSKTMVADFSQMNIVISEARWSKRPNVHIVSHWLWPATLKELNQIIQDIKATYNELCSEKFR